ncbi:Ephrin-B2a [Globodera pallida]|nr:Ephrin-B2a [Globodera pallida]
MNRCSVKNGTSGEGSSSSSTCSTLAAAHSPATATATEEEEGQTNAGPRWRRGQRTCPTAPAPASSSQQFEQFRPPPSDCLRRQRLSLAAQPAILTPRPLLLLHFLLSILCALSCTANARKSNEIEVDWTLRQQQQLQLRTLPASPLARSEQLGRQFVPTKYLRLKDVLSFRCPSSEVPLAVHLVPAESALLCQLPAEQRERERALIGYCGPNTSDPRLTIRQYSPLPGKPTFREGLSYFFISTSDGTAAGVQATSGGLCRSNALRLRVVVLPTPVDNASAASRPADEITDLAELLFPHSRTSPAAPPPPPSPPPPAALLPSPLPVSFGVFPAILTLEDRGGQRRQVLVHSPAELAAQIDSASQRSGGAGLELSVHQQPQPQQQQQRRRGGGNDDGRVGDGQMPRYELSNNNNNGEHGDNGRHPPKSVRSPDPLAESQKLVYIIGYGDNTGAGGHEATSDCPAPAAPIASFALSILMTIIFLLIR